MQKQLVVISIVTYNSKHIFEVLDNLQTKFAASDYVRVAVFDNNSELEYQEKLKKYDNFADIYYHDQNEGFGKAHNKNLLKAEEPFYLLLNPDALIDEHALTQLLDVIQREPEIGLVVPRVLNIDGTTQYLIRDRVSVFDYALRFIPFKFIKKIFDKRLAKYECRNLADDQIVPVRIGSGCCMLLRKEAFQQIKEFDDRYFMYFEDYDLCLELAKNNYKIMYNPFAHITHFYGKEAHKSFKLFNIFMLSLVKFFNKWGWHFF